MGSRAVMAKPSVALSYLDTVLADSPYLLWKMDETSGTAAADSSGNSRPGTYNGTPALSNASGYPDGTSAPYFDQVGAGDWVQSNANANSGGGTFSAECWFIKDDHLGGQTGDINSPIGDLASVSNGLLGRYNGDTTTLTVYVANGSSYSTITCTTAEDTLYHFVITSNGSTVKLYLNGSEVNSASISAAGFNLPWRAGRSEDGRHFKGSVGWVALYTTALSAARVAAHYAAA